MEFEPVLAAASERITRDLNTALYLYGSVATGQARLGSSDVDLLAIDADPDVVDTIGRELTELFEGTCRGVEIGHARPADLDEEGDAAYGLRVFLRHYCVHLAGPARHASFPDYPADGRAARGFNGDIALHAEQWRAAFAKGDDHVALGRRIARKLLLAVAGLVSVQDSTWTSDRRGGARRWAEIEPHRGEDLDALVSWADGEVLPSRDEVSRMLAAPLDDLVHSFESKIGLWR